ncbi:MULTISPECIES: hypothetical protein [Pseudomonas]|jgi:hypothetical protein|nr:MULTISPECIES: hypothetical protein [Pseudomonas]MBI6618584.1 hypothetical protein [Pseudomonas corrugata]MBI6695746.1 hypothetical protein [Pseudomonas corrugata]WRV67655.1 hypothetical protein VQ575_22730 [Pseudomonas frederiksbergensis]
MNEQILAMSGDFESDLKSFQDLGNSSTASAALTIVECGTIQCTAILC